MNKFKSYLPLLAYSLLGTSAYYFYIQLKRKKNLQEGNTSQAETSEDSEVGFNANLIAKSIHLTMKGWGTDEDEFFEIGNSLSDAQREAVKIVYEQSYNESLKDAIESDFAFGKEDKALKLFGY
jgi:hypothetical protein